MSEQPLPVRRRRRWLAAAGLLLALLSVGGLLWGSGLWGPRPATPPEAAPSLPASFPLPPISASPFRNTGPDARYVGSETCTPCHQTRTASFRRTGMGCSMAEVDAAREPADAAFDHPVSKRRYQITRKQGQLWHRELLLPARLPDLSAGSPGPAGPEEVVLSEYPLKYVVGSGRHARTYLVEAEGFLVESPVTWYASRKSWGMSPGYDRANHLGFQRGVGEGCLVCHAGHAQAVGHSLHRMQIKEAAISCERCHGPGSLHVAHHQARKGEAGGPRGDIDYTIVNPPHLSRELAEAVCQQCHLHSAAAVPGRGRKITDFRPGLPLQDFRQDYGLEVGSKPMTVVGHVEQMHLSRCYKESATLTCTTCHNPHAFPPPEKHVPYYRAICLSCHKPERCRVEPKVRMRDSPDNNCVRCHMPSAPTEVLHVSFTHHRIGIHGKPPADQVEADRPGAPAGTLRPFLHYPHLGTVDSQRSLGLGYLNLAENEKNRQRALAYREEAFTLLSLVHRAGLREPMLETNLARQYFEREQEQALPLAESALADPGLTGRERCIALFVAGGERLKRNQFQQARVAFRELVTLRRHPDDWIVLADCEQALGHQAAAVAALETAVRIDPRLVQVHQQLAQHYRQQGDARRAAWHQQRAVP
ncbi:MAG: hypothetical protein L0Z62_31185 [Gemmataceae bacterium]|nr:hypothetical protein [Gemmataceae bacterium]